VLLAASGVFGICLNQLCFVVGLSLTNADVASILQPAVPPVQAAMGVALGQTVVPPQDPRSRRLRRRAFLCLQRAIWSRISFEDSATSFEDSAKQSRITGFT